MMTVRYGYNFYPTQVEDALYQHPGFREAAAIDVSDSYRGETVKAIGQVHGIGTTHDNQRTKRDIPISDIKARISQNLQKFNAELASLGGPLGDGNSGNIVLSVITEFTSEFRTTIDGNTNDLSLNELSGGARISFVFHELYANGVKAVDPFDQVKDIDIRTILYNSSGSSPALFVNTAAFELIVKQQIKRLEEPSLKCVSLVYDELVRILTQLLGKQLFRRYPQLKEKFHQVVISFFKKTMDPTNKLVKDLVAMESCYINTGHPDFLNGHRVCFVSSHFPPQI